MCGETPNPTVKDPGPQDVLKRRGNRNFCQSCYQYCCSHSPYCDLDSKGIIAKIEEDQEAYDADLAEWESNRRQGKRCRTSEKSVVVEAETRSSITTRVLLGYLWSQGLLKRHKLDSLWAKHPKTTVVHCGKPVTGILREVGGPGAVEIYSDSQTSAVRKNHKSDTDVEEDGQDGEQALQLKSKRARFEEEDDDFLSVWGIAGVVTAGAKGSRDSDDEADQEKSKPKKRGKGSGGAGTSSSSKNPRKGKQTSANQVPAPATPSLDDLASQPDTSRDFGMSSSWLFGGKPRGAKGKGGGKGNKELDNTEKVLNLYDGICKQLENEDTFMSLTFKKVTDVSEKLTNRSTEELMKVYRDLSQSGSETQRAVEVMRRLAAANTRSTSICQLVSALHDGEATAGTLRASIDEARDAGVSLPISVDKIAFARVMLEISASGQWDELLDTLQGQPGLVQE
ncbi:unnamed protein product [Symbiodinium necroappetens]|uniref:Uncharacterized protein n=1 Tax=Symbiodinium necroappetens TaxID=1628268 RepID=A0A812ZB51_9DINO|nr:unnamed protein product [Symbiodinium necroappetens]